MLKVRNLAIVAVVVMLAAGCETPEPIATKTIFDPVAVAFIHERGPNAVNGQAFLRQKGGGVVTCAGRTVSLIPSGAHSRERIRNEYGTTRWPALAVRPADQPSRVYLLHMRRTICDAQGNFAFSGLADGDYFVETVVNWEVAGEDQGGALMAPVSLWDGASKRVMVTP